MKSSWDLWVDYHRVDSDGLTHANVRDAEPGVEVAAGNYLMVGSEDAETAVAEIVSVDERGAVLLRVLSGPAQSHISKISLDRP